MSARPPKNLIDWLQISDTPNWSVARPLGVNFAVLLTLLFLSALIAAFSVIWRTGFGAGGDSLGAGTLVVAILSAPFLIWSTVLKHQTLRYQKEGHITDRINKAVEQLGSKKTVKKKTR